MLIQTTNLYMGKLRKMIINKFDNFTKCKSAVVGKVNHSLIECVDEEHKDHVKFVFQEADKTLDSIVDVLNSFGVTIHRPQPYIHTQGLAFQTPNMQLKGIKNTICPTDSFAAIADTIVECPSPEETAYFDHTQYKHIWQEYFDRGSKWIAAPIPTHHEMHWDNTMGNADGEILFDGPAINLCGDTMFVSESVVINKRGTQWLRQQFPQFKIVSVEDTHGHLDAYFCILRPGVIFSSLPKNRLPSMFAKWDVIESPQSKYIPESVIDDFLQDNDYEHTTLEVTGFSIDENNYLMNKHMWDHHPDTVKLIESYGVTCIPIEHSVTRWLGQGLCCMVNSIVREGTREKYF